MMFRVALSALLGVAALSAQDGLRLTRVPDRVVLPPGAGANLLVEVAAAGKPTRIWLARGRDQIGGVPLVASGEGRWQINLADAKVLRLLPADRADGTFRVFARIDGRLVESAEIAWSRAEVQPARVRCFLVDKGGKKRLATKDQIRWLDPNAIERIEIHGTKAPQARVVARAGTTDLPLSYREREQMFALELNEGLRASMQEAGALALEVRIGTDTALFDYHIVPDRLAPVDEPGFVVQQRRHAVVPGSRDWLEVRIADITMGKVLLSIVDAEDGTVVAPRHVSEQDGVAFSLSGESYVLRVDRLKNLLIGDDYAELSVTTGKAFEPDRIALLIHRVEAATDITFVREGKDYNSVVAAQLLRARLGSHRGKRPTPGEFAVMAGKSSTTGNAYVVRKADGTEVAAQAWLEGLLGEIEKDLPKAK